MGRLAELGQLAETMRKIKNQSRNCRGGETRLERRGRTSTISSFSPARLQHMPSAPSAKPLPPLEGEASPYDRAFWLTYFSNLLFMVPISLQYRYGDFVRSIGGTEYHLGWIVGVGTIGSIAMRLFQGVGIDRYGPRSIWLASLLLFVLSSVGHLYVDSAQSTSVYVLRTALSVATAGVFGASITAVSRSMSLVRMTEVISVLGTSGFVAMALGPTVADQLFAGNDPSVGARRMFWLSAALATAALALAAAAMRDETAPPRRRRPATIALLRRYRPPLSVLLISMAMGAGFAVPSAFLTMFAESLGIRKIGGYFIVYSLTALVGRLWGHEFPSRFGPSRLMLIGLAMLVASFLAYLPVRNEWHLLVPAVAGGLAHAYLFPAVVATGSASFPNRYRGLGTTVILATLDLGAFVGAPAESEVLRWAVGAGLPKYPTLFIALAVVMTLLGCYCAVAERKRR